MAPKTIKKKSSAKRKSPRRVRSAGTTPRHNSPPSTDHNQIEAALHQSEERFRAFTSATNDVVYCMSPDWTEMRYLQGREFIPNTLEPNRTWLDKYIPVDDQQHVMETIQQAIQSKGVFELEHRVIRVDGSLGWTYSRAIPILDDRGEIVEWFGAASDVTQRKQVEAVLHTVEARQRVLLKSAPVVIYSCRVTGDYGATFVSENVVEQLGHRPEDFTDDPEFWANHIHPDDRSRILADLATIFETGQHEHEYRFLRKDGTYRWLHDQVRVIRDEAGAPLEMIGFQIDISQRKEAEGQLHQNEERLNQAIRLAKLGIFDHDHRTETLYWSPMMREIYGVPSDEPASIEGYLQLLHPHDRDAVVGAVQQAHDPSGDGLYAVEHRILRRDGSVRWVSFQSRTLFEGEGPARTPVRTMGAMVDMTDRKQAEEALQQKQRELEQSQAQLQDLASKLLTAQDSERQRIARDLHDDFSQRLTALVLDVGSLQRHPPLLPELIGKALEPVREELAQLSNDLHSLAYRLHPSLLRHAGLQAAIEDHIYKAIERTGLHISLKAKDLPSSIPLDWSTCLFRVFQESLQNVVKHAKATEVLVKLSGSSKGIGLSVIDNGKGFDERDRSGYQKGMGLISMQERLRLLNGFLNIHARLSDGTKVCAWIPFREKKP